MNSREENFIRGNVKYQAAISGDLQGLLKPGETSETFRSALYVHRSHSPDCWWEKL